MNYKYIIIGLNIVFASAITIGVALYTGYETLLGAGFSFLILGIIITGMGLTYIEPLDRFYRDMARIYSIIAGKVFEDTGLIYGSTVQTCREAGLVIIAKGRAPCNHINPGIGVADGSPYIAIPTDTVLQGISGESGETLTAEGRDLEPYLRDTVLRTYDIGRDLVIKESGERLRIRIYDVRPEAISTLKLPLNPFKILVAASVMKQLRRDVIIDEERFIANDYILEMREV